MGSPSKEARVLLALEAIQSNKKLNVLAAARLYNVPETILRRRRASGYVRRDVLANLRNLTDLEEQTIVQYVIELSLRVFPPRLYDV